MLSTDVLPLKVQALLHVEAAAHVGFAPVDVDCRTPATRFEGDRQLIGYIGRRFDR